MAEEAVEVSTGTPVDVSGGKPPEIVVDVEPEKEALKPTLSDEEVEKLAESPAEDEVQRYAKDAQRRIKSLHTASQEWRKRVIRANNDLAAATNLATQLYEENKHLKHARQQGEAALVEQAIQRADAQLAQARQSLRAARMAGDIDAETKASEEMARYVAEGDRLRLLKPSASGTDGEPPAAAAAPAAPAPGAQPPARPVVSQATQGWVAKNPWFNDPKETRMRNYAMAVHGDLVAKGITEETDPQGYFGTIDEEMRKVFPERFKTAEPSEARPAGGRPVAVVGAQRAAAATNGNGRPRHVTLSESQIRIARSLDLTPEQYALQLVKEGKVQ